MTFDTTNDENEKKKKKENKERLNVLSSACATLLLHSEWLKLPLFFYLSL